MKPKSITIPIIDLLVSVMLICVVSVFVVPYTYAHTYIYGMCVALVARVVGYIPWCSGELSPEYYTKRIRKRQTSTEVIVQLLIALFWLVIGFFYSWPLFFVGFHGMWLWYLGADHIISLTRPSQREGSTPLTPSKGEWLVLARTAVLRQPNCTL